MIAEIALLSALLSGNIPLAPISDNSGVNKEQSSLSGAVPVVVLSGDVDDEMANKMRELDISLKARPEVKEVLLAIDSYGGAVDSMNVMLDIMDRLKAKGVKFSCYVDSKAMSAAQHVLMNCNEKLVEPRATIMFHVGSMGSKDGGRRVINAVEDKYLFPITVASLKESFYILTLEEQQDVLNGVDVFITGQEFMARLAKHKPGSKHS